MSKKEEDSDWPAFRDKAEAVFVKSACGYEVTLDYPEAVYLQVKELGLVHKNRFLLLKPSQSSLFIRPLLTDAWNHWVSWRQQFVDTGVEIWRTSYNDTCGKVTKEDLNKRFPSFEPLVEYCLQRAKVDRETKDDSGATDAQRRFIYEYQLRAVLKYKFVRFCAGGPLTTSKVSIQDAILFQAGQSS